jgi:hypothetical protein
MADMRQALFSHPPTQVSHDQDHAPTGHPVTYKNLFREPPGQDTAPGPTDTEDRIRPRGRRTTRPDGRSHRAA